MNNVRIVFFGSTSDSVLVLQKLPDVVAVVTQPPKPIGRKQVVSPTPVELWAKKNSIPVLTFPTKQDKPWEYENEQTAVDALQPLNADLLISASYGQKIPAPAVADAKFGGLNVHPSLLPRWRGTDPVPWTILTGDHQTGVTIVTLSQKFDEGKIIAQKKFPVEPSAQTVLLRAKLFSEGADLLVDTLPDYISGKNKGTPQNTRGQPYAKRLTRDDGFEPWDTLTDPAQADRMNRKFRALHPWPGLWTRLHQSYGGQAKRLKILEFTHEPVTVQLEGKNPVSWKEFAKGLNTVAK